MGIGIGAWRGSPPLRGMLAAVVVCVLAACDRGSKARDAAASPAGPSSGLMPAGTPYESLDPCPRARDPRLPPGSGCAFMVRGDVDGDGRPDAVFSYGALGPDGRATRWLLRTVLSSGGTRDVALVHPNALEVLGTADASGDGRSEIFVQTDRGASTAFAGIFTLDRGRPVPVTEGGGAPVTIGLGGSVTHGDGGRCTTGADGRPELMLDSIERGPDGRYAWVEKTYAWSGTSVHLARTDRGTIDSPDGGDAALRRFYELTCGSLRLGA